MTPWNLCGTNTLSTQELSERLQRLQVERESLESKMEAEKHVMRAQLRDLMEKQQAEVQRMTEQHQAQLDQTQQDLMRQLEDLRRAQAAAPPASQEASGSGNVLTDSASIQRIAELEGWCFILMIYLNSFRGHFPMYILGMFSLFTKCSRTWGHFQILSVLQTFSFVIFAAQAKQKTDEASRSEAKFLKMKAWSKSRIRQLEEELKRSQVRVSSCPSRMNKAFCAFVLCLWQRSQIHCQCSKRGKKPQWKTVMAWPSQNKKSEVRLYWIKMSRYQVSGLYNSVLVKHTWNIKK